MRCLIWSVAVYAAETWTLTKVDVQQLEAFECGYGEEQNELVGWTKFHIKKCWQNGGG